MQEQVFVASRRTIGYHVLGAAALLALSIVWTAAALAIHAAGADVHLRRAAVVLAFGPLGVVISGAVLVAGLQRLARPARLIIGKDGVTIERSFSQPRHIAWVGVQAFYAGAGSTIGVRYDKAHGLTGLTMGGGDGFGKEQALSVSEFDVSAYAIVQLLNQAMREGVTPTAAAAPKPAPPSQPAKNAPQIIS